MTPPSGVPGPEGRPGRIDHVRGALVAVHLVLLALLAAPSPTGASNRLSWREPTVQRELHGWHERLTGLGLDAPYPAFEDGLYQMVRRWNEVLDVVLWPSRTYARVTGAKQPWKMFVAPHTVPSRLHVDVRVGGDWQTIHRARDPELVWFTPTLDHDRIRSATFRYAWPAYRRHARRFAWRLAQQVEAERSDVERVRVRFWRARTPSPEEAARGEVPEGRWVMGHAWDLPLDPAGRPK